jgi:hypothetical protein
MKLAMPRFSIARSRELLAALALCGSISMAVASDASDIIARLGRAVRSHDVAAVQKIDQQIAQSSDARLKAAYLLANYFMDPTHQEGAFINGFPTDRTGFTYVYSLSGPVTGQNSIYAFAELSKSAQHGNRMALRKLLLIDAEADGAVAEFVSDRVDSIARHRPANVLTELAKLPWIKARNVATNPLAWCDSVTAIQSIHASNEVVGRLQRLIRDTKMKC